MPLRIGIRKKMFSLFILGCVCVYVSGCFAQSSKNDAQSKISQGTQTKQESTELTFPEKHWESVIDPERHGYSSERLKTAKKVFQKSDADAVMVVSRGRILLQYGDLGTVSNMHSARKAMLSLMYRKYVSSGKINPKMTVAELGIDDVGGLSEDEKKATIEDLLKSRSGVYHEASMAGGHPLPPRGSVKAGEQWIYNNWDFNAAGAIFEKLTGKDIFETFRVDLADTLGMEDYDLTNQRKTGSEKKSIFPGYMFRLSTQDMARVGHLMLNKGKWKNTELYPGEWVKKITSTITPSEEIQHQGLKKLKVGFGMCWWTVYKYPTRHPDLMEGAFYANGSFGQNILVIPKAEMVIVTKVDSGYFGYQLMDDIPMETLFEMSDSVLDARI